MEDVEKRKRARKRTRKSKTQTDGATDEVATTNTPAEQLRDNKKESQHQHEPQPSRESIAGPSRGFKESNNGRNRSALASTSPSAAAAGTAQTTKGPSLSFHQRTNPHKPSALSSLQGTGHGRAYTVSVALPGSVIMNAQTPELQARLAGHVARSCAIFNVDEIVVFDEGKDEAESVAPHGTKRRWNYNDDGYGDDGQQYAGQEEDAQQGEKRNGFDPNAFLARILQYIETPQYLRKALFPMHRDLRLAGLLAPLDCPHHLRFEDQSPYREGVCVEAPHWAASRNSYNNRSQQASCWVDVGLRDPIACFLPAPSSEQVPLGARVTVKMPSGAKSVAGGQGRLVSPREPVEQRGVYWGYTVRLCSSLSEAISNTTWSEPYDFVIGTSERGTSLTDMIVQLDNQQSDANNSGIAAQSTLPSSFKHALIVLGGLSGLEVAVERDGNINASADEASELFDAWINVVEGQGSRTIRTEEALLITLARLKSTLETMGSASAVSI